MPIDTPEATGRPLPPSACHNGCCCWRANRSQAAISTAPLAMKWPRTRASAAKISRGCAKVDAEDQRRDELADDVPGRLGGLAAVVRVVLGDALAPAHVPAAFHFHEQEEAVVRAPEAGLEMADQRQAEEAKLEAFYAHGTDETNGE